jgi:hypothetical protein
MADLEFVSTATIPPTWEEQRTAVTASLQAYEATQKKLDVAIRDAEYRDYLLETLAGLKRETETVLELLVELEGQHPEWQHLEWHPRQPR